MYTEPNTGIGRDSAVGHDWLAGLLLRRRDLASRFALSYQRIAALPRSWRRLLKRRLAVTTTSAALLLALAGGPIGSAAVHADQAAPEATITVVNGEVADVANGKCSLIEAIINARVTKANQLRADCTAGNLSGPDTISLPTNGNFVLTATHNSQSGATGLPVITGAMTIEGHGATIRRSDVGGTPAFRILAVDPGVRLTVRDATIDNGFSFNDSNSGGYGGAILSYGTLELERCTISGSYAEDKGGGIFAAGPTTIVDSVIIDNHTNSEANGEGGGVFLDSTAQATITGSTIIQNQAAGEYLGAGGGISVAGQATIIDSTIAENEGMWAGGGIHVAGQATVSGSTIRDNVVYPYYRCGYYGCSYEDPGYGGGLGNSGTTVVVNTTVSGNEGTRGAGLANFDDGNLTVVQTTVTGNASEASAGGLFAGGEYSCGTTTVRGTIISGNTAGTTGPQILFTPTDNSQYDQCAGPDASITVNAFNVFGQSGQNGLSGLTKGATDIVPTVNLAGILSPLADNGGPTETHVLASNSPALDLAPNASCTAAPVNGVDQRGEPRNTNGKGGASANECDAGSVEGGVVEETPAFYVSPAGSGTVGGVAFAPADILKYDPATGWSMFFDGSDVGVTKNLSAFEILDNGHILLSLGAPQSLPGVGGVQPHDVLRFTPTSTGNNTAGSFSWQVDGSTKGLTTANEKIDALGWDGLSIALSTVGAAAVKLPNGANLKAQDEDLLRFNFGASEWSLLFNGTPVAGLGAEDVNAAWIDVATGEIYISIVGAFNLGGVAGDGKDIVKLTPNAAAPGGYAPSLWWDGSAAGFPVSIDGLELAP